MKTNEERKWCVYMHTNKINNKVYVGQTCNKPSKRWKNGKGYINNKHFWNAICKYGWSNFEHIVFAENLTKEDACKMERLLIALYDTTNKDNGYNYAPGGETCVGIVRSEETHRKLSQNAKVRFSNPKNNPMYGRRHTKESKFKISESHKGISSGNKNPMYGRPWWDENTPQEKIDLWLKHKSEASSGSNNPNYGVKCTEEKRDKLIQSNPNTKAIAHIDKDNNIIEQYRSMREANRATGIDRRTLTAYCNGARRPEDGTNWIFFDKTTS